MPPEATAPADDQHSTRGAYVTEGESFDRDMTYIDDRITRDGRDGWPVEGGRYRLIAARACPWANRTLIARRLLGLEDALSVGMPGPTHDKRSWTFDLDEGGVDPVLGYERLQQAYFARFADYPRGITVPAIVDVPSRAVVTNDFQQITLDLAAEWTAHHREGAPDLYPVAQREEIDALNRWMLHRVNNGVYKVGFAGSQDAYETEYRALWSALDELEERLGRSRYLMGASLTEADVRLFPTLIRFDPVYHGHFKANRQTLASMPNLWNYTKDLFTTPGFGDTVDFSQIKRHYYYVHEDINPTQVVPLGPDLGPLLEGHDRDRFETDTWGPEGSAPPPPLASEVVDPAHTPLHVTGR
ncbi:glutathione S-transferase family protein [Brachybacterium saurashtrense]|uniref:Glutathione S-transferase family protein n=1 Tax=Brachybacterium saurashtrense TaxID=556288 RepID=A0A345YM41_9MICO|nr:glutathione S-transferase C-terminal domain-containing protein [Brachybacterium saurashtrense]AXK44993.1 glutathione S-transferase family protein [Brachybacterium saurashtrense]RRR21677.1 glutathione S-transferase family protein [Brachybacterium saurashtrense]